MPHCAGTGPSPTPARHPTSFRAPLLGVALALAGGVRRNIDGCEPAGPPAPAVWPGATPTPLLASVSASGQWRRLNNLPGETSTWPAKQVFSKGD